MDQHAATGNPYTRGIADFVANLRYDAIPAEVIARIKLLILDSLGCAIFGADLPWSQILLDTLSAVDTSTGTTIWGTRRKLSAPHAALVNGTLVQSFELDEVHRVGVLHVGAVTLPPVLAIAEMNLAMTGRDFLTACVAGYEIGPRVGICMGPEHIGQGWHSGDTVGVFSACAGAAAALRLPADQVVHALGIALKFYSCVGSNHTTLDAIRLMQARHPFGAEDVARVLVRGSRVTMDHVGWPYVAQGMTSAQLNLPYCVATLLLDGDVFVDQFTEEKIADPDRMRIAAKVAVVEDAEITARGSRFRHMVHVTVTLNDGTTLDETVEAGRGSEHSFASAGDVIGKFRKLAARRNDMAQVDAIVAHVMDAERMAPAYPALVRLLARAG